MSMTAKHFEKLANVINEHVYATKMVRPINWATSDEFLMLEEIASDIADVCEGENGLFDRDRFLAACGVN